MAEPIEVSDARVFLESYAADPAALQTMEDDAVLSYYERVNANTTKFVDESVKKATEGRVPEKYELKLPDETRLPETEVESIAKIAKEQKLSNVEAQLLLDQRHDAVEAMHAQQAVQLEQLQEDWKTQTKSDPEIGGEHLVDTQRLSQLPIEKFMNDDLRTFLKDTGYGDHPEVVRFLRKVGEAMSEDGPLKAGSGGISNADKQPEDVLYGKT